VFGQGREGSADSDNGPVAADDVEGGEAGDDFGGRAVAGQAAADADAGHELRGVDRPGGGFDDGAQVEVEGGRGAEDGGVAFRG
jgi:hypothetical protein